MQILGINNYYQSKYINTKQRKTDKIKQLQTSPESLTFRGGNMLILNGFKDLSKFKNIQHPDNKAFYEQLKQKLQMVPYSKFSTYSFCNDNTGYVIRKIYDSCLDGCDVVNKAASEVLFNMCNVSDDTMKEIKTPEWHIKKSANEIYEDWGLDGIATLLERAKDKDGYHDINNLELLLYLFKTYKYADMPPTLTDILKGCMNNKGIVTSQNSYKCRTILNHPQGWYLSNNMNDVMKLSDKGMEFTKQVLDLMKAKKDNDYFEREKLKNFLTSVISTPKADDPDNVYDILLKNLKYIVKDYSFSEDSWGWDVPPIIQKSLDARGYISAKNLDKLLDYQLDATEFDFFEGAEYFKDKKGIIRDENAEVCNIVCPYIYDYYSQTDLTRLINEIKDFTDKDGIMKKEYGIKLADLCEKYGFNSSKGTSEYLLDIISNLQNSNKPVDWDIVETLCKYVNKARNSKSVMGRSSIPNYINDVFEFIKDEKTGDILPEKVEIFKKYSNIENPYSFKTISQIETTIETENKIKDYFKNNSDYGNLYTTEDMLELLRDMKEDGLLREKDVMTVPIKDGDSALLMYIADILPTEKNTKKYDKIIKIIKDINEINEINYNFRDELGVSFLEKVIMSENSKLLDLLKDERLEYYPELEYAYENIQNPEFKEKVKELNIILTDTKNVTAKNITAPLKAIALENTAKENELPF